MGTVAAGAAAAATIGTLGLAVVVVVGGGGVTFGFGIVVVGVEEVLGTVEEGMKGLTVVGVVRGIEVEVDVAREVVGGGEVGGVSTPTARTGWVMGESVAASMESDRGWKVRAPASAAANANMAKVARGRVRVEVNSGSSPRALALGS